MTAPRTVFFVSDGTGITAETIGHSLLSQFESLHFRQVRMPFVDSVEKAGVYKSKQLNDDCRTLVNSAVADVLSQADAVILDFFKTFIVPFEAELGARSTHTIGRAHGRANSQGYTNRIEAINFTLAHDDGVSDTDLDMADVILVGVSRSGKTPTSLYLAVQFGIKAANYPLIPEDFERNKLPGNLEKHRHKLFGLTIGPDRLAIVRNERRPDSVYASLDNCRYEVKAAQKLMRREGIRWLDSTTKSIEEIAATLMQTVKLDRDTF